MPATGSGFHILGLTVGRVAPVHDLLHLSFDERVTALYGLNGSGKTRILTLVEMALSGVRPEQDLTPDERQESMLDVHIRVPDFEALRGFYGAALGECIGRATRVLEPRGNEVGQPENVNSQLARYARLRVQDILRRREVRPGVNIIEADGSPSANQPDPWETALDQAAMEGRLTLRASGSAERPSWDVYLAITPTDVWGSLANSGADNWWADSSSAAFSSDWERVVGLRADLRAPLEHHSLAYLDNGSDKYGGAHSPKSIQVPSLFIGRVESSSTYDFMVDVGAGQPRSGSEERPGFQLAIVIPRPAAAEDVDRATLNALTSRTGSHFDGLLEEGAKPAPDVLHHIAELNEFANQLFHCMMTDPQVLSFELGQPEDWLRGNRATWYADGLHVSTLSASQARWASLAITMANVVLQSASLGDVKAGRPIGAPIILICDEPELGLHRLLEHRMGKALFDIAQLSGAVCLLATHSPDLLASPHVHPMLVSKDKRSTSARSVQFSLVDGWSTNVSAGAFGLSVGDLWALARLTVVVEGVHDEWVFKTLLRDSLDNAVAGVFPIHGAARLRSLAEARLLISGTDAPILVVLDDLVASHANQLMSEVKGALSAGDDTGLRESLERMRNSKGDSYLFLHQFVIAAIEISSLDRIYVHGLSLPDVICYLPPDILLESPRPWEDLIAEWRAEAAPKEAKNIKRWLRDKKLLPETQEAVDQIIELAANRAASEARPVHPDLVGLGLRMLDLSRGQSATGIP